MNTNNRFKTSLVVLGTILIGSLGYGFMAVNGQPLAIWGKDVSGHVVLFPRTLTVDIASSTLSIATTTLNACTSVTWNPGSLGAITSSTSTASTTIALPGSSTGDICVASLTTATSTFLDPACHISSAGTSTITLYNNGNSAVTVNSGTARVCNFK